MNSPNPKKAYGDKKPPLHLLPLAGMVHQSLAHMDGDLKYGFENWNDTPVEKLTYIGAALRHLELYKYGETHTRDTTVHNLGGVMACCAILLDAELNGNLIDNTKHSKATCDLLHNAEIIVDKLKAMQVARDYAKARAPVHTGKPPMDVREFVRAVDEQERIDKSWADAANETISAACDVAYGPIKTYSMSLDAGIPTDAGTQRDTFEACGRCKTDTECCNRGYCLGGVPPKIITAVTPLEKALYSKPVEYFAPCSVCPNTELCINNDACCIPRAEKP